MNILEQSKDLEQSINRKRKRAKRCSSFLGASTIVLNVTIIVCSATNLLVSFLVESRTPSIVLNSLAGSLAGLLLYLSIGNRGFYYLYSSMKMMEILENLREMMLSLSDYTDKEVRKCLYKFRREADEIDLSLYKLATTGIAKFGNGKLEIDEDNYLDSRDDSQHTPNPHAPTPNPQLQPLTDKLSSLIPQLVSQRRISLPVVSSNPKTVERKRFSSDPMLVYNNPFYQEDKEDKTDSKEKEEWNDNAF